MSPGAELGAADLLQVAVARRGGGRWSPTSLAQGRRLGPAARLGNGLGVGGEQDREPQPDGDLEREAEAVPGAEVRRRLQQRSTAMSVTRTAVISTTNMTGLRASSRGSSLRKACGQRRAQRARVEDAAACAEARRSGFGVRPASTKRWKRRVPRAGVEGHRDGPRHALERLPGRRSSCSTIGPSASAGKKLSAPTMRTTPTSRPTTDGRWSGTCPGDGATRRLAAIEPAIARIGTIIANRPIEHRQGAGHVVEGRVAGEAGERRAVVARLAGEGVQDLAEAVRARVERPGLARRGRGRERREAEDARGQDEDDEHGHLHLEAPRSSCPGTPACARPSGRR